ncbi:CapA family protein [Corallococcus exiguus]|uniref:CapA family protein n=1 Tax=Corallococcus exiguus TaxID=83462 RepID=UPI001C12DD27
MASKNIAHPGGSGLSILAVGDVFVDRDDPATAFHSAGDVLRSGDVVFGNCEGVFSDDIQRAPSAGSTVTAPAANAAPLAKAGFNIMSLANNHSLDGGHAALLSMRRTLADLGIATAGAGANLAEATAPAYLERNGTRLAFLAFSSVFPYGYEARPGVPGLAPFRAHTRYTPVDLNAWNPGMAPVVSTEPLVEDQKAFIHSITEARAKADIVVVSFHWGDSTQPFSLTDHERRTARLAIDHGADVVVGHHHHMLRGVEFHSGKPIFYGLGHYLFDLPNLAERLAKDGYLGVGRPEEMAAWARKFGEFMIRPREGYPLLPFHPDSRLTGAAVIHIAPSGRISAGFLPAIINPANEPMHVSADSDEGRRVVAYLERCCTTEQLPTRLVAPRPDSGLPTSCIEFVSTSTD